MKTLVKVLKIEEGFVLYQEIDRNTGNIMIEDYISVDRFVKALQSESFGFELVKMTKQQAIKTANLFGANLDNWEYSTVFGFSGSVITKQPYDNGYGYMQDSVGVGGSTQSKLCANAIITHHTFEGIV